MRADLIAPRKQATFPGLSVDPANKVGLLLCADDFGLSTSISQGILQLVKMQRLSAVSCMVNGPAFKSQAPKLLTHKKNLQTGLHFNLTEGYFLSQKQRPCFSLLSLLIRAHLRILDTKLIRQELEAQLSVFIQTMGCLPDFIDGHQHVHQFPQIRPILLDVYENTLRAGKVAIRATYPAISIAPYQYKSRILALTGGIALSKELKDRNIPHNACFAGIYDFGKNSDYRSLFKNWLAQAKDNTLIMCHPGEGKDKSDGIAAARKAELTYLSSDAWIDDMKG